MMRSSDQARIALAFALIATAAFLALAVLPRASPPPPLFVLPEFLEVSGLVESSFQLQAHNVIVLLLALCVLSSGWLVRQAKPEFFRFDGSVPGAYGIAALALPLLAWVIGLPSALLAAFLVAILVALSLGVLATLQQRRWARAVIGALCFAYLALIVVPGYVGPLLLPHNDPSVLVLFELHLTHVVQSSSLLAAGFRLFDDVTPTYGILVPVLTGILERNAGFLDVGDQVRLAQLSQIVFLILALTVFIRVQGKLLPAVLPLVMVGPYLTTAGPALWQPNQSGIRQLVFPLGLLALQSMARLSVERQAALLGFTAAWLLMFNVETGIAVLCGFAFHLYLRSQPLRIYRLACSLLLALAGAGIAIAIFALIHRIGLGSWLTVPTLLKGAQILLERVSEGQEGGRLLFDTREGNISLVYLPLALAMFLHGLYLVVLFALRARCRRLATPELFCGATAAILVVWMGYYFNYPSWWNLWTPIFLYGVIVAALFDVRRIRLALARPAGIAQRPWYALLAMLILMACAAAHVYHAQANRIHLAPDWRSADSGQAVSGVIVPTKFAEPLLEKAAYLERAARAGSVVYATVNSDFMPVMSHVYQPRAERDFLWLARTEGRMRRRVEEIARSYPDRFLIDSRSGPLAVRGPLLRYQERIARIVSGHFVMADRVAGWEVWVPKKP